MRTIRTIGIGPALALLSLACSNSSPGDAGASAALELPACLQQLIGQCAPEGACIMTTAPAGFGTTCFDSGVSASANVTSDSRACGGNVQTMTVAKSDGTPCYTFESYLDASNAACSVTLYTWKDAAGNVVATGMASPSPSWDLTVTCAMTAATARCTLPMPDHYPPDGCCNLTAYGSAVCRAGAPVGVACTNGVCP